MCVCVCRIQVFQKKSQYKDETQSECDDVRDVEIREGVVVKQRTGEVNSSPKANHIPNLSGWQRAKRWVSRWPGSIAVREHAIQQGSVWTSLILIG